MVDGGGNDRRQTTVYLQASHAQNPLKTNSIDNTVAQREYFNVDPRRLWRMLLVNGYRELPVTSEHTVAVNDLPPLHKDPFDRILVAQAKVEGLLLLTANKVVAKYGDGVKKV